jgi:hypothetical protein
LILVTITLHAVSPEAARDICRVLFRDYEMRLLPGSVRRSCVIHTADPRRVLIIFEWGSRAQWDAWAVSGMRAERLQQIAPLLARDLQIDVYEET